MDHSCSLGLIERAAAKIAELIMNMRYHIDPASGFNHGESSSPREISDFGISLKHSYDIISKISRFRAERKNVEMNVTINFFMERKEESDTCLVEKWTITAGNSAEILGDVLEKEQRLLKLTSSFLRSTATRLVNLPLWSDFLTKRSLRECSNYYLDHEIVVGARQDAALSKSEHKHYETIYLPAVFVEEYGRIRVSTEYLTNLDYMSENRSASSNITFVLSEEARSEAGKFNLRSNMRERFFSDDISGSGHVEKKKKRTHSVFLDPRESTAYDLKYCDKQNNLELDKAEIINIREDDESLLFRKVNSKDSECEFLIIEDEPKISPKIINETSRAILAYIKKLKDTHKVHPGPARKKEKLTIGKLLGELNKSLT